MYRKAIRIWVVNALRVMTVLWLVAHFTLTAIYVLPTNPAQDTLKPLLDAMIGKYFNQGWALFAPNPISANYELFVRPLSNSEFRIAQTKGLPNDGWYDLSSPMWTKFQSNRFSAYNLIFRPSSEALLNYLDEHQQQ